MKTYWIYYKIGRTGIEFKAVLTEQSNNSSWLFAGHVNAHNREMALKKLAMVICNVLNEREQEYQKKEGLQATFV